MKFTCFADINAPIDKVVALFNDPDNLGEWQEGFQSITHLSGEPGTVGAQAILVFHSGKHVIELKETILTVNLPYEMKGLYEHIHMHNTMTNQFDEIGEGQTRYTAHIDYFRMIGILPRIMAFFFAGKFRAATQQAVDNFKAFVERQ